MTAQPVAPSRLSCSIEPPIPGARIALQLGLSSGFAAVATAAVLPWALLTPMDLHGAANEHAAPVLIAEASTPPPTIYGPAPLIGPELPPDEVHAEPALESPGIHFVVEPDGQRYLILERADQPAELTRAEDRLIGAEDFPMGVVRATSIDALPQSTRALVGETFVFGDDCRLEVGDVVLLSIISGSPEYATDDTHDLRDYAWKFGATYYAAPDTECLEGSWARRAHKQSLVASTAVENAPDVASAKRDLLSSDAAQRARVAWEELGYDGTWQEALSSDEMSALTARHPVTGDNWLLLHMTVDYGCGGADINLVALYRERDGRWARHSIVDRGEVITPTELVDVDGDGVFEILGSAYLGGSVIMDAAGETLEALEWPFYGCPC